MGCRGVPGEGIWPLVSLYRVGVLVGALGFEEHVPPGPESVLRVVLWFEELLWKGSEWAIMMVRTSAQFITDWT